MALLEMTGIGKRFGPVTALAHVDLRVGAGEVHALIGENGAGKSTLMKILSGAYTPDSGQIAVAGEPVQIRGPGRSRRLGIGMIYQELTLAPHLSVAENITLGMERHLGGVLRPDSDRVRAALDRLGYGDLDPRTPVHDLGVGVQQIVEIARSLLIDARLIIMDEPTSSLGEQDTQALFTVIRRLRESGVSVIYISHFLEEVKATCDRYTVLRDGASVATGDVADTPIPTLIRHMVGREVADMFPRIPHDTGEVRLAVDGLRPAAGGPPVSWQLRRGEILGIAGLVGAGRTEILRSLFGLDRARGGSIAIDGGPPRPLPRNPHQAMRFGLDMLSENRKEEGLATSRSLRDNITLNSLSRLATAGVIHGRAERQAVRAQLERLAVRCRDENQRADALSGGNQQKVAIARNLLRGSDILLLDEPTRGIDVGSKVDIYRLIGELAAAGKSLVVVSSYLPELFGICDSLGVVYRGSLSPIRPIADWTPTTVMSYATSGQLQTLSA